MLTVFTWKWGARFAARHVNVLRSMLWRNLHVPHQLVCVTDDPTDIDPRILVRPMPTRFQDTPRCRRRMQQFDPTFMASLRLPSSRILAIDLDVVIVGDLTPIVNRPEPIVGWRVGHAGVVSGSFLLFDDGALEGAWRAYAADPDGFPRRVQARGTPSDQAMVNFWLAGQPPIALWTEADGFVTYYGQGYERFEHLGVGAWHQTLPPGARIVVLGSADLEVLDDARFPWVVEHYR